MYKLLLATDRPEIMNAFGAVSSWESLGFKAPRMVSSAQGAIESLKRHHADGIAYALSDRDEKLLGACLAEDYPLLPIFEAGRTQAEVVNAVCELRALLNRTHADFSNDSFGEADMMQLCRHEFFRALLGGMITDQSAVMRRMRLLRSRMDPTRSCVVVELTMPEGDSYLKGRWHYGTERLEVALRNFFGVELNGMRMLVSVLPDERIFLLACPMLGESSEQEDSMTGLVSSHAQECIGLVSEYLGLNLSIAGIRVLPNLSSLAAGE